MESGTTRRTGRSGAQARRALPDSLRVPLADGRLAASGLRARAEAAGADRIVGEIDGIPFEVAVHPPLAGGPAGVWPFGALCGGADGDLLFAAADQPVVVLDRAKVPDAAAFRLTTAGELVVTCIEHADGRAIAMVHPAGFDVPDADTLLASAVARARRRATSRPTVTRAGAADEVAAAEYGLRRHIARARSGLAMRGADERATVLAVLAFLALNDPETARELVLGAEIELASHGSAAALVTGAWAAWRGSVLDVQSVRAAASVWLAREPGKNVQGGGPAHTAAAAFAPTAAESLGDAALVAAWRARGTTEPLPAIGALLREAADEPSRSAARVLALMHEELRIVPDALRGRLSLGPATVAESIEIGQIGLGDATLEVRIESRPGHAVIEVEQTSGGTPITVVLEPGVPGRRLTGARVDETTAELEVTQDVSGLRVRVQLVVDQPRRLGLDYES